MKYNSIPSRFSDFLIWLKQRSEKAWENYPTATLADYQNSRVGGQEWQKGTKWIGGYSEYEIDSFENTWNIKFPLNYRQFLQILGAPDRPMFAAWYSGANMVWGERPSFYDWRKDSDAINDAMAWPLHGTLFDVERNDLWLENWGTRPNNTEERRTVLSELVRKAPTLIPIVGHRYLLGVPLANGNPVLSIYQSDIICYGSDLRNFLILELHELLGIDRNEAYQRAIKGITQTELEGIPFWGEIIAL